MKSQHIYDAILVRVIDGDSISVDLDQGFGDWKHGFPVRLAHINAPELTTKEGHVSKAHLQAILGDGRLVLKTHKPKDKYGRYLAEVYWDDNYINDIMVADGMAVYYEGGKR